ncbi:uncharacterized protein LOC143047649 [Mytilus galloprovincialis]|uniref:uncharacterized protein LOC143047649 n=1 Tax=Mytilus galloprovincialis TaxID=29158 RepID=UPI003F7C5E14
MKFAEDNQLTIKDLSFNSDEEIKKLDENITKLKVCGSGSRRNSLEAAKSPNSSKGNGKCGRPSNPIPRHKRDSHIKAEHKRRDKIQKGFDSLRELVPALENVSSKESKSSMLFKTAEYCRQLKVESKAEQDEALALHHEIEALGNQIHILQMELPAVGIKLQEKSSTDLDAMFDKYVKQKTQENWKFWMFRFLLKPLFEAYKKAMEGVTREMFVNSVGKWVEENMSLINLRPAVLSALRKVSTKTKIMDKPEEFKRNVEEIITHLGDVNGNDSSEKDAELRSTNTYLKTQQLPKEQSNPVISSAPYHHLTLSPNLTLSTSSPQVGSDNKFNHGDSNLQSSLTTPSTIFHHDAHVQSSYDASLPNEIMSTNSGLATGEITNDHSHDVPMTSFDLWDIPSKLPSVDSSSSLVDMVYTSAEENILYDSILNSFRQSECVSSVFSSSHDLMQVQPLHDLSDITHELFPSCITTASTTCHNSTFPVMSTGYDHTAVDMLTHPSFSDLDIMPSSMESSVDPITFLLDADSKDSTFHSSSFSNL